MENSYSEKKYSPEKTESGKKKKYPGENKRGNYKKKWKYPSGTGKSGKHAGAQEHRRTKSLEEYIVQNRIYKQNKKKRQKQIQQLLMLYDIESMRQSAVGLQRHFTLHVGPTNSGKTYHAIEALKKAETGVYLGPLRLLALEMYDRLNAEGYPCELLTGEEYISDGDVSFTASTIEMCDFNKQYDVAVIDEAQLISDAGRGDKWTKAIYLVNAYEVHICLAPEALPIICKIIESFGAEYTVINHERLTPLIYKGFLKSIKDTEPGDALIVFSRRAVLGLSAELRRIGKKVSVIYGALPPASRREEVRRFVEHETDIVVATDAIGMGISIPIKRIIFCEDTKYDGIDMRPLNASEVRQIAGRAGRYGIYGEGYVMTMTQGKRIERNLEQGIDATDTLTVPFPEETLDSEYSIKELFNEWTKLPEVEGYKRASVVESGILLETLGKAGRIADKRMIYELITCPVDVDREELRNYWLQCALSILMGEDVPEPGFGSETLELCELQYKALDIRHQILRRIGVEDARMQEKMELCRRINFFLQDNIERYLKRCRCCTRILPPGSSYGLCDRCFSRQGQGRKRRI